MKKLLFALMLLAGVAYGQSPTNYTRIVGKYRWTSGMFDSMFYVPRYNGTPSSVRSGETSVIDGAVAVDTANSRFYIYSGGTWVRVGNYSEITGLAVDSVWRVSGIDSIFWRKNSVTYAIKDSSNVGTVTGTGTTNYVSKFTGTNTIGNSQLTDASNVLAYTAVSGNASFQIKSPAGYYYPGLNFYSNGTSVTTIYGYLTRLHLDATGNIYMNGGGTGNVLIGTGTDAGYKLDVNGNTRVSGNVLATNVYAGTRFYLSRSDQAGVPNSVAGYTVFDTNNRWNFYTSSNTLAGLAGSSVGSFAGGGDNISFAFGSVTVGSSSQRPATTMYGSLVINESGDDHDVRIEGDTDANLFFTDASTDRVGIGNNAPAYKLDVTGKIRGTDSAFFATSSGSVGIGTTSPDSLLTVNTGTHLQRGVRMSGIPKGAQTYSLYVNASGTIYKDTVINNAATTYTPTLTNTTNIDSSTAFTTYYKSDGDWVHVWGEVEIDPTAATTLTVLEMDIPIGGTFNVSRELAGTAATEDNSVALIKGSTLNSKAIFRLKPNHSTLSRYSFTFSYKIVNP